MISVTRRYRFPAAHVLRNPAWDDAENERVYGKCANPEGHGHDYGVDVTVSGAVDPRSGRIVDPDRLDQIFDERVSSRFSHTRLNDVDPFRDRVPTAENIAAVIHGELEGPVADACGARLVRVRVVETRKNSFVHGDPE